MDSARTSLRPDDQGPRSAEVVRSEEELVAGTRTVLAGRVRVRKRVVTETVTRTVEVRREELVVEELDAADGHVADAAGLGVIGDDVPLELVLHEEEVVLSTRVVPRERVRVSKDVHTEHVPVEATLRREQVETDWVDGSGRLPGDER